MIGIYSITNIKNGKRYIGQSRVLPTRLHQHFSDLRCGRHGNEILQRAWDKYGEENFISEILEECLSDELDEKEKYYIKIYKSDRHERGYNIEGGGRGNRPPMSEETRKKLSDANKGRRWSEESKQKLSNSLLGKYVGERNPMYGKSLSPEHIEKMRVGRKNTPITDKERELHRQHATNISDETRRKRSQSLTGQKNPMWGKLGVLSPFFGRKHTDEAKRKMSEAHTGITRSTGAIEKGRRAHQGGRRNVKKTSKYVGVSLNKVTKKWMAYITINGKSKNLGAYILEEDAARAYNDAAISLYGDGAKTNALHSRCEV